MCGFCRRNQRLMRGSSSSTGKQGIQQGSREFSREFSWEAGNSGGKQQPQALAEDHMLALREEGLALREEGAGDESIAQELVAYVAVEARVPQSKVRRIRV